MPRPKPPKESPGLREIRASEGMQTLIARGLGITRQAVSDWKAIPLNRVIDVETLTGIDRAALRPDIFNLMSKKKKKTAR